MDVLSETVDGEAVDSGRIKHIVLQDVKVASVLWFRLHVTVDALMRGLTYRIEPVERPLRQ